MKGLEPATTGVEQGIMSDEVYGDVPVLRRAGPLARVSAYLSGLLGSERGASMVEYSIIIALVVIGCIAVIGFLGRDVFEQFTEVEELFP